MCKETLHFFCAIKIEREDFAAVIQPVMLFLAYIVINRHKFWPLMECVHMTTNV